MHTILRRLPSASSAAAFMCVTQVSSVETAAASPAARSDYECVLRAVTAQCPPSLVSAMQARPLPLQTGFALSRLAATTALQTVTPGRHDDVFTGQRLDAERDWAARLSLSHEDTIAAAVAWRNASTAVCEGEASAALPAANSLVARSGRKQDARWRYAVDIGDVTRVLQLYKRFPKFHHRWLPQCCLCDDGSPTMQNARILAQHWSIRECCVKLVGIPSRSFTYACLQTTANGSATTANTGSKGLALPSGELVADTLYTARVTGCERDIFAQEKLEPIISLQSWLLTDLTALGEFAGRQYAVTVTWCAEVTSGDNHN